MTDVWSPDSVALYELPLPPRTHRFSDLVRLVLTAAVMGLVLLASSLGSETTAGLSEDISNAVTTVPGLVVTVVASLSNLIVLALPVYLVVDLVLRRRWRLLSMSMLAAVCAGVGAEVFKRNASHFIDGALLDALTLPSGAASRTDAAFWLFASVSALMTVQGQASRTRTVGIVWATLLALSVLFLIDARATPLALLISVLGGHLIGLIVRYVAGTENPRVDGTTLASALERVGIRPLSMTQLDQDSELGRRFDVVTVDGVHARMQVFDPDRRASVLLRELSRLVRLRAWVTRAPAFTERSQIHQMTLPGLMAYNADIRVPRVLAAVEVADRTMAMVEERPQQLRSLDQFSGEAISDDALRQLWTEVRRLHHAGVAHEGINPGSFCVDDDGRIWLTGLSRGEIAASRLRMRLDRAELLTSTALMVGHERAIAAAEAVIGPEDVATLPPLLQRAALNPYISAAIKPDRSILETLRDEIISRAPVPPEAEVKIQRLSARSVVSIVALTFAVYILAGQLSDVNFATVLSSIDWIWAGVAVLASLTTYFGSAWTISPFSPVHISQFRWFMGQFAATFVTLVAPAAVGHAGTNVRMIQQAGAPSGLAIASVGVATVVTFLSTIIAFAVLTAVSADNPAFDLSAPSSGVLITIGVVLVLMIIAFIIPVTRRMILARLRPTWENTGPRMLDMLRNPKRMFLGAGGSLVTTVGYAVTLFASVKAYGADIPIIAAAVVYLGANLLGSAAPTPGGIGAVEAALVAGLGTVGVGPEAAIPAALLYRTVTFWLPTVPGWFAFQWLQRRNAI